jgi:uncharacterized protein
VELFAVPFQDAWLLYRPLARLAIVANRAMADLASRKAADPDAPIAEQEREACDYLRAIGFLDPDPPPPGASTPNDPYRPTVAVLCLTTACNLRCVYCYARGGEGSPRVLPIELGRLAIETACRNARRKGEEHFGLVFHGGGEPTLAMREMRALVEHARAMSLQCRISTASNGCWSQRDEDWLLDNIDEVSLSLDGAEAVQNRQRPFADGSSSFGRALAAAQTLDRRRVAYGIRLTVTDEAIEELPAGLERLCRETACQVFQVEPAFPHGRARHDDRALTRHERFARAFFKGVDVAEAHRRHVYYSGARPWLSTARFCQAIDSAMVVTPEGALTACYEVCGPDHPLVSRFSFGTIDQDGARFHEASRRAFIERIDDRRRACSTCFCCWHCAGDCPSKTLTPDGAADLAFGDRCQLNRTITRQLLLRWVEAGGGMWRGDSEPLRRLLPEECR